MKNHIKVLSVIGVLVLASAACSSSGSSKASNKTVTTTAVKETTTTTTIDPNAPTMTVTPSTGLTEGQTVQVTGAKFPPNDNLGINECADKGADTGAGDCDLSHLVPAKSDAQGNVTGSKVVTKGPFGSSNIVCSAEQPCLLSISELVAGNPKNASQGITFAG